jgi:hypothetical protein
MAAKEGSCHLNYNHAPYSDVFVTFVLLDIEYTRLPIQAYKYQPSVKRDIDRPRRRWRGTIPEVGTGASPNP